MGRKAKDEKSKKQRVVMMLHPKTIVKLYTRGKQAGLSPGQFAGFIVAQALEMLESSQDSEDSEDSQEDPPDGENRT